MNDSPVRVSLVVDDADDTCDCDSVYHSVPNTPVVESVPLALDSTVALTGDAPRPDMFSIPEPDSQAVKDERSFERARQRLKKPGDVRKAKRCVRCRMCKPEKWAGNAGRPKQISRGLLASLQEAESERKQGLNDSVESTEESTVCMALPDSRIVALADLVKPTRKPSDKQFEIVGRPRQVLVMDEFTEVDSKFDLDDWEYVEADAKHRKAVFKGPTYARVVASRV